MNDNQQTHTTIEDYEPEKKGYEIRYQHIYNWFLSHLKAYACLKFVYKYLSYFVVFMYILLTAYCIFGNKEIKETIPLFLTNNGYVVESSRLLVTFKIILTPMTSFILLSVIRKCIDAKRPYEKYNITPLISKKTVGESMPSRHIFSITIIAMCWMYISVPIGTILIFLSIVMAVSRVLAGVHFIRDVIAGFIIGILCGFTGLWIM
ncbi:MAG: phosphatase PAP2 family protein [Eubacteriales bacterium]|nr:phosphatase PAP2 family protein [Eubacteriales bacterium]